MSIHRLVPVRVIKCKFNYSDVIKYLTNKWNIIYSNNISSSFSHPTIKRFTLEVFGGNDSTTIWGFTDTINYFIESVKNEESWFPYQTDVATDNTATIFKLTDMSLPYSTYTSTS